MKAIFPLNHGRLDVLIGLLGAGEEREDNWRIGMRDKLNVMIGFLTVKSNEEIRDVLIPVSPSRYRSDTSASSRKEKEEAYSLKTSSSFHCLIKFGGSSVVVLVGATPHQMLNKFAGAENSFRPSKLRPCIVNVSLCYWWC